MSAEMAVREEKGLIKERGAQERVLKKLESFKVCNLSAREKEEADRLTGCFVVNFIRFCWKHLGVSREQLKEFDSEEEVRVIDEMLAQKIRPRAIAQKILLSVSVCGLLWVWGNNVHKDPARNWGYLALRKKLKKLFGKDYFPYEELRKQLT